ncbi:MAG: glycosyltransferase family 4 protein, partial [Deltaproteobacteria bacterium]|nr:glycosyltransferase family 4 protein [Deltaproteobacteria bacterium]
FKRISAFLCIGEENRKFYEHYGAAKEKLFFAPYAVDNNFFMSEAARLFPKKSELRKLLGLKGNKFIFLFVGKFIDKKRPMDLIRAYELVKDPKKALVMVGDGILKEEAAKYVREQGIENVIFAGFKNQTELPEYYALADALVLPSGSGETWGLVVNEAMCFGLSVIVSDVVGCGPDLVKQDENGFVFHLGNIKELSHCLEELAADPEKKERFGKRSIEIIRDFSFDKDADAIASSLGPIK